jgi:glutathione S-transferase
MILYDYVLSASCYKVRLMAALLNIPLTLKAVNFHPEREHKSPDMLALNPKGTLPVLVDGHTVMAESTDMLRHLAELKGPDWLGEDDAYWLDVAAQLNATLGLARLHDILSFDADISQVRQDGIFQLRQLEERLSEQRIDGMDFLSVLILIRRSVCGCVTSELCLASSKCLASTGYMNSHPQLRFLYDGNPAEIMRSYRDLCV